MLPGNRELVDSVTHIKSPGIATIYSYHSSSSALENKNNRVDRNSRPRGVWADSPWCGRKNDLVSALPGRLRKWRVLRCAGAHMGRRIFLFGGNDAEAVLSSGLAFSGAF